MSDGIGLAEALRASSGTAMRRHGPSTPITSMPRWCSRIGRELERAGRVGAVAQLGVDETSFLAANRRHSTIYATGLVDLEARIVIDMVEGNGATWRSSPTSTRFSRAVRTWSTAANCPVGMTCKEPSPTTCGRASCATPGWCRCSTT